MIGIRAMFIVNNFIVILLLFANIAGASDWVWRDGYYWNNGQAYNAVRERVFYNGCWQYRWNYYPAIPSYKDPNWREKLTEIVAAREKYNAAMKLSALEHAEWLEAIAAIGKDKDNYSLRFATGLAPQGYAQQGSSVYGTIQTQVETQNFYNPTNLDVQWNQADRHVDKAQNLAGEALNGFRETLREASQQEASAKERVAAIYAKAALLKAADTPEITIKKETRTETVGSGSTTPAMDIVSVIQNKCVNCHSAQNPQGGIDITKYDGFDAQRKEKVRKAITNPDPEHRMPLKKEGDKFVPGEPLSFEELVTFTK